MTAHQLHPDPSVCALIERERRAAAAEALREAAEASFMDWVPVFYEGDPDEWINEKIRRWLNHRADSLAATATQDPA